MSTDDRLIRFDWAIKRLLRHKADHTILNGFLSSLLEREIKIVRMLESEGNQEYADDKFNRVDILAENEKGEKILIEVQNDSEDSFFHRMSYGASKLVTEYIKKGEDYDTISQIFSVNIVYFRLGVGDDYVYKGTTQFVGLHDGKVLELSERAKRKYDISKVSDIFPTFYLLKANDFDKWSSVPLDQWMFFLGTSKIPEYATAPGLAEAREELRVASLSPEERHEYYRHLENMTSARNVLETAYDEGLDKGLELGVEKGIKQGIEKGIKQGKEEGLKQGKEEGIREERRNIIRAMLAQGMKPETIANIVGISLDELHTLL